MRDTGRRAAILALAVGTTPRLVAGQQVPYDPTNRDASSVRAGRFAGKVCLVTGATSGIGKDAVLHLAAEGCRVAFTGRREDKGKEVEQLVAAKGGQSHFIRADNGNPADNVRMVEEAVAKYGRLDAAFNNAGIASDAKPFHETSDAAFERVLGLNLHGVFYSMKAEIAQMLKQGDGGTIVNCGSLFAKVASPGFSPYITSKHGLTGLTRGAALEYAEAGIRVNQVEPGFVRSELTDIWSRTPAVRAFVGGVHPAGRWVRPEEVSGALAWLLSDDSSYVSGESIEISSGVTNNWMPAAYFNKEFGAAIAEDGEVPERLDIEARKGHVAHDEL